MVYMAGSTAGTKKIDVLESEEMPSKTGVMCDITLTSLPLKASVMHDAKGWSY